MTVDLHLFDRGGRFGRGAERMEVALRAALDWFADRARIGEIDLIVHPAEFTLTEGLSVEATDPHTIVVALTPGAPFDPVFRGLLHGKLTNALFQILRRRQVDTGTVAEALIRTGLAKHAEIAAWQAISHAAKAPDWTLADPRTFFDDLLRLGPMREDEGFDWLYFPEPAAPPATPPRIDTGGWCLASAALDSLSLDPFAAAALPTDHLLRAATPHLPAAQERTPS